MSLSMDTITFFPGMSLGCVDRMPNTSSPSSPGRWYVFHFSRTYSRRGPRVSGLRTFTRFPLYSGMTVCRHFTSSDSAMMTFDERRPSMISCTVSSSCAIHTPRSECSVHSHSLHLYGSSFADAAAYTSVSASISRVGLSDFEPSFPPQVLRQCFALRAED